MCLTSQKGNGSHKYIKTTNYNYPFHNYTWTPTSTHSVDNYIQFSSWKRPSVNYLVHFVYITNKGPTWHTSRWMVVPKNDRDHPLLLLLHSDSLPVLYSAAAAAAWLTNRFISVSQNKKQIDSEIATIKCIARHPQQQHYGRLCVAALFYRKRNNYLSPTSASMSCCESNRMTHFRGDLSWFISHIERQRRRRR